MITQFIKSNNLKAADAIELVCPQAGFPKHYAVYIGTTNGFPQFIANITEGIQILSKQKLTEFIQRYQVTNIERFNGNLQQRKQAVNRALSRLGEKAYSLIFNNCEHFKNWVLIGEDISKQVASLGTTVAIGGITSYLLGCASDNKGLKKSGAFILAILLFIIIIAFLMWQPKQTQNTNLKKMI